MSTLKAVIHAPTGAFKSKNGGFDCHTGEPQRPILGTNPDGTTTYDPDYDVVVVPRIPDPRTEKWDGSAIVAKTAAEVANYDATIPNPIDGREFLDRFTDTEYAGFTDIAKTNITVRRLLDTATASATVDVNHTRTVQGLAYLKSVGVPSVWADNATADQRIKEIRGLV